ncbi:MAG: secretion protein F [Clostridia bacterium]|nr:secretion protein F [Clostridia bacterium]
MIVILITFVCLFSLGIYLILSVQLKLATRKTVRAILTVNKRDKRKAKNLELFILGIADKISKVIKISIYKKRKLMSTLKSAEMHLTPEAYIAKAIVKAGFILFGIIPALFIFPILAPVILFTAIAMYFKEINSADEALKEKRRDIEYELPRFVSTLTQELQASRDVLSILETYKNNASGIFKRELEITVADMKTGNSELALTRFETRIGSSVLSEIVRGLIGVLRGDNGVVYFQMLNHDLKVLELQRLKTIAVKQPGKLRKYSFMMLGCFILMYLVVMAVEIYKSLGAMF